MDTTQDFSTYSMLLRMEVEETGCQLALGTGFIYEHKELYYLITNGHNVTGVNPETHVRMSKHAGFPTRIGMMVRVPVNEAVHITQAGMGVELQELRNEYRTVRLYTDDHYEQPIWYVHPEHKYRVDVIAIPLGHKEQWPHLKPITSCRGFNTEQPHIADDVYIIGYPFGITDPAELPIWKRGSIASEPFARYKGLPALLVDTASRSGMSGSPVILMRTGVHHHHLPDNETYIGTLYGFVGVYSGRIGEEAQAQLGIVWRKEVIQEIISAKVVGTIGFQSV